MPQAYPFRAIRYQARRFGGDISRLIAPPYDVLDEADRQRLLAGSEHNIVAIDLPHIPPKSAGPAELYQQSAGLLKRWLREGVLTRDAAACIYPYHQRFSHAGREYTRRMLIANLRLAAFSEKTILPHEQTFGGPKEDRLALVKATECQLSPIFGMYSDPANVAGGLVEERTGREPDVRGTLEGVENRMWVESDAEVIRRVAAAFRDRVIYIADGHHRYGTALLYRDWLSQQLGGKLPDDHPANFVMFVLCSMEDPGCLILPYHRVLGGINIEEVVAGWAAGTSPAAAGAADIRLWDARSGRETALRFTRREVLHARVPDQPGAWYELDYSYLHTYLIDELLARALKHSPKVHYVKSEEQARQTAREQNGVALLMNATKMAHLRAVSEAGGLMPQKSTYFHPKLATGMTIHSLA
jgi:uncharacterized protein (DUF1015 family)